MDLDKLYAFATGTFSDYFRVIGKTLGGGRLAFSPIAQGAVTDTGAAISQSQLDSPVRVEYRLNPQLFGYLVLSVALGVALQSLQAKKFEMSAVIVNTALLAVSWILYGSFVFLVCRIMRGGGSYLETISMMVQLLATVFVVSNFFSLSLTAIASGLVRYGNLNFPILQTLMEGKHWSYYMVHTPLLMIYVPIVLRPIHRFGVMKSLILALTPVVAAFFGLLIIILVLGAGGQFSTS